MSRTRTFILSVFAVPSIALLTGDAAAARQSHVAHPLASTVWSPAPPMLPSGAEIAVLEGDPSKDGAYTVRLKFPANYNIAAHSHPTDENVVVVSGTFYLGMGNKLDRQAGQPLAAGGYVMAPAGMNHFAYTKAETTILLYGHGPVDFKYVNPADDPRNAKK